GQIDQHVGAVDEAGDGVRIRPPAVRALAAHARHVVPPRLEVPDDPVPDEAVPAGHDGACAFAHIRTLDNIGRRVLPLGSRTGYGGPDRLPYRPARSTRDPDRTPRRDRG